MKYHKGFEPWISIGGLELFGHKRVEVYKFKFPLFNND